MPIDREETLKKAEKFLRQGRLDQAIAEYERVVEDQPRDWTTANALGDLYLRGNQTDRAVGLYQKIADHLFTEGFYPKAAALYRKILKLAPGDEKVLSTLAEISTRQGLLADAKTHLQAILKRRRDRGDHAGADDIVIRLGTLDPADVEARLLAARTIEARGDKAAAAGVFREVYEYLAEKGRDADALGALKDAVRNDPSDAGARAVLAKAAVNRGDFNDARQYLDRETAANDPAMLFALINLELQTGRIELAQELLPKLFALDPGRRYAVVELAWTLLDTNIFAASACIDAAANALIAAGEFGEAASILQEFATRVPGQVNALLKLVEVCVDGGLEATMYEAQAQLADAYLAIGLASEARVIAEDLLSREPWESAHMERLRRALVMLKVPNVEAVLKAAAQCPPRRAHQPGRQGRAHRARRDGGAAPSAVGTSAGSPARSAAARATAPAATTPGARGAGGDRSGPDDGSGRPARGSRPRSASDPRRILGTCLQACDRRPPRMKGKRPSISRSPRPTSRWAWRRTRWRPSKWRRKPHAIALKRARCSPDCVATAGRSRAPSNGSSARRKPLPNQPTPATRCSMTSAFFCSRPASRNGRSRCSSSSRRTPLATVMCRTVSRP